MENIGEIFDRGTHWALVYDHCGHSQEFARNRREDQELAVDEVRLNFADV